MTIMRQTALDAINAGNAYFAGVTRDTANGDNGAWIINNTANGRTDHVAIADDEPLVGCIACGTLVEPEPDTIGCGCHCPECNATL